MGDLLAFGAARVLPQQVLQQCGSWQLHMEGGFMKPEGQGHGLYFLTILTVGHRRQATLAEPGHFCACRTLSDGEQRTKSPA